MRVGRACFSQLANALPLAICAALACVTIPALPRARVSPRPGILMQRSPGPLSPDQGFLPRATPDGLRLPPTLNFSALLKSPVRPRCRCALFGSRSGSAPRGYVAMNGDDPGRRRAGQSIDRRSAHERRSLWEPTPGSARTRPRVEPRGQGRHFLWARPEANLPQPLSVPDGHRHRLPDAQDLPDHEGLLRRGQIVQPSDALVATGRDKAAR
jgi:hypothetical protein